MAYFNHNFPKTILANGGLAEPAENKDKVWHLNELAGSGMPKVAFIGVDGSLKDSILEKVAPEENEDPVWVKQRFKIAGSTLRSKDKIGKFAGGYQSVNDTKVINPNYVSKIYAVFPQKALHAQVGVGNTTSGGTCADSYYCGTTYYLQLDVKGSSVASVLMHNYHSRIPAYVSCCNLTTEQQTQPLGQNGVEVYYEWAKYINNDPTLEGIVSAFVTAGGNWYGDTSIEVLNDDGTARTTYSFDALETAIQGGAITKAGLVVVAAYSDTKFGNCSFNKRDGYNLEPIQIEITHVDVDGNPCVNYCDPRENAVTRTGIQDTRTGETVLRDVILEESYHQRFWSDCQRKREVEGSDGLLSIIDRSKQYPAVYVQYSIPRLSNPSGTFDSDVYLLQIVLDEESSYSVDSTTTPPTVTLTGNIADVVEALEGLTGLDAEISFV